MASGVTIRSTNESQSFFRLEACLLTDLLVQVKEHTKTMPRALISHHIQT